MPVAAIRDATTVERLVLRMYGELPAPERRAAVDALIAANPHVRESAVLEPGTVVVVPPLDVPNAAPGAPETDRSTLAVDSIATALEAYRESMAALVRERMAQLDATVKLTKSDEFAREVRPLDGMTALLAALDSSVESERESLKASRELLGRDIDELRASLERMRKSVG